MAKFEGKQGRWITTKTGRHVFVERGKSVKQALAEAFEEYTYDEDDVKLVRSWYDTHVMDKDYEKDGYHDLDIKDLHITHENINEWMNNPQISSNDIKRFLQTQYGITFNEADALYNAFYRQDYEEILKERKAKLEQATFQPRIKAAEEYLSTMSKLELTDDAYDNEVIIAEGANYNNYHEAERVYKYGWDDKGEYNPEKAKKLYDAYTSNCQRCVMAWFLRNQGYDVQALEWDGEIGSGNYNWEKNPSNYRLVRAAPRIKRSDGYMRRNWSFSGFNIPDDTTYDYNGKNKQWASTQFKEISKMVEDAGSGAVYFCSVYWRGQNSGHVFIVHNDNGKARFIDPQDNSDASKYFDKNRYGLVTENTTVLRVDKLTLNGDILPDIVKKYEEKPSMEDKVWKRI